jgi:hypothetical protein
MELYTAWAGNDTERSSELISHSTPLPQGETTHLSRILRGKQIRGVTWKTFEPSGGFPTASMGEKCPRRNQKDYADFPPL